MSTRPGELLVVATPIGNLGDLSPRAAEALREAGVILAEDTRRTLRLLSHHGIRRPLEALHEHNERTRAEALVARLLAGERMVLVSDAGTPLLSDPGCLLLAAAHAAGVRVSPVPGPSAVAAALSVAGFAAARFVFEGFLPARPAARRARLQALAAETRTLVFYEAPHRLLGSLTDLAAELGTAREALLGRELTKVHETLRRAALGDLARLVADDEQQRRGEVVLVVAGAEPQANPETGEEEVDRLLDALLEELPPRRAAAVAARLTGARRNDLYRRALARAGKQGSLE